MISESELLAEYRDTVRPLYAFVSRRTGYQRDLTEDVVQETYLKAVRHWRRTAKPAVPLAWLKTVARNTLISHYRQINPRSLDQLGIDVTDNSRGEQNLENSLVLYYGLTHLKPQQALLLEALYFDGKRVSEIASELGLSERAVEGRLRRARKKLEKILRRSALDGAMPNAEQENTS